ncbi:hypothetical protein AVEN_213793-1 [Araneus ventricosus]|uniref:Uncharacterized protein n=1 Tax=Araneus ventricosus TaxID=182803 RepID=A0A4Y2VNN1_ARAVE|nr:hypothetical protein AVEN_213793-1 [Araneus ventricosus]
MPIYGPAQWRTGEVASLPDGKRGPLNRRQFGPPNSPVPKAHVLGIYCRRNPTSRTAGGRIPTQDAYAITTARRNCTEVSVQSTSFDLLIIYRCFSRMLQPSHKPSGYWNRVARRCKVEPQYSLRFFVSFGSPGKTEGIASLCAERMRFLYI